MVNTKSQLTIPVHCHNKTRIKKLHIMPAKLSTNEENCARTGLTTRFWILTPGSIWQSILTGLFLLGLIETIKIINK